jgi:hypothetical protein
MQLPVVAATLAFATVCVAMLGLAETNTIRFQSKQTRVPDSALVSVIDWHHVWAGLTYSSDGGGSWTARLAPPEERDLHDVTPGYAPTYFATASRGWLSGAGAVWATSDKGITWSRLFPGGIFTVVFSNGGTGWMAVGDQFMVRNYVTRNLGQTWSQCGDQWVREQVAPLGSASFIDNQHGWITVAKFDDLERPVSGGVAATEDGGCTWKVLWWDRDNASGRKLGEIHFADGNNGWLLPAGYGGALRTSDGGIHWRDLALPDPVFGVESGHIIDATRGWILGTYLDLPESESGIFFTADGGVHWRPIAEADLESDQGLARDIPVSWSRGVLMKLLAMHHNFQR